MEPARNQETEDRSQESELKAVSCQRSAKKRQKQIQKSPLGNPAVGRSTVWNSTGQGIRCKESPRWNLHWQVSFADFHGAGKSGVRSQY